MKVDYPNSKINKNLRHEHSISDDMLSEADMEIILILSDEKGHATTELAEKLGIKKSNLSVQLVKLRREQVTAVDDAPHFSGLDFKEPIGLALELCNSREGLSNLIFNRFDPESKSILAKLKDYHEIIGTLVIEMNRIIDGRLIFKEEHFAHIKLSERSQRMLKQKVMTREDQAFLNRFLLEDAFPAYLRSSSSYIELKNILYRISRDTTRPDPKHPSQQEWAHFICKDLWTLDAILEYFESRDQMYEYKVIQLLKDIDKKIQLLETKNLSESDNYFKEKMKIWEDTKVGKQNISYWLEQSDKNLNRLQEFLGSAYAGSLIKERGISKVLDTIRFSDITEKVQASTLVDAYNKQYISKEEALEENKKRGWEVFLPSRSGGLFVEHIMPRRFVDIDRQKPAS